MKTTALQSSRSGVHVRAVLGRVPRPLGLALFLYAPTLLAACSSAPGGGMAQEETETSAAALKIGNLPDKGGWGEPCLPGTPSEPISHCDEGLGCNWATNLCGTCGGPGQPCCDGLDTPFAGVCELSPVGGCPVCNYGACNSNHTCESCGNIPGQACCPPDVSSAVARCFGAENICVFSNADSTAGTCQNCGAAGDIPCPGGQACNTGTMELAGICMSCSYTGVGDVSFTASGTRAATLSFFAGLPMLVQVVATDRQNGSVHYKGWVHTTPPADTNGVTSAVPTIVTMDLLHPSHTYDVTITPNGSDGNTCPSATASVTLPDETVTFSGSASGNDGSINDTLTLKSTGAWALSGQGSENLGYNFYIQYSAYALYLKLAFVDPGGYGFRFLHVGNDWDQANLSPCPACSWDPYSESGTDYRIDEYWDQIQTTSVSGTLWFYHTTTGGEIRPQWWNNLYWPAMAAVVDGAVWDVETGSHSNTGPYPNPIPLMCPNTESGPDGIVDAPNADSAQVGYDNVYVPLSVFANSSFFCATGKSSGAGNDNWTGYPWPGAPTCTCCFSANEGDADRCCDCGPPYGDSFLGGSTLSLGSDSGDDPDPGDDDGDGDDLGDDFGDDLRPRPGALSPPRVSHPIPFVIPQGVRSTQ
jgi:hypothetical protein